MRGKGPTPHQAGFQVIHGGNHPKDRIQPPSAKRSNQWAEAYRRRGYSQAKAFWILPGRRGISGVNPLDWVGAEPQSSSRKQQGLTPEIPRAELPAPRDDNTSPCCGPATTPHAFAPATAPGKLLRSAFAPCNLSPATCHLFCRRGAQLGVIPSPPVVLRRAATKGGGEESQGLIFLVCGAAKKRLDTTHSLMICM